MGWRGEQEGLWRFQLLGVEAFGSALGRDGFRVVCSWSFIWRCCLITVAFICFSMRLWWLEGSPRCCVSIVVRSIFKLSSFCCIYFGPGEQIGCNFIA